MENAKNLFLTILRDKNTSRPNFRKAADTLSGILAHETLNHIPMKKIEVQTPIEKTIGIKIAHPVTLVPILRSGITMVEPFLHYFYDAKIGVVGLRRDEETAKANLYYNNIPPIEPDDTVIILDPMIATGGTGVETLKILKDKGIKEKNIIFASIISSPEGIDHVRLHSPNITILTAGIDQRLNDKKFIVPGLGDFGDRYFGTE